jgi:hypothetical protein
VQTFDAETTNMVNGRRWSMVDRRLVLADGWEIDMPSENWFFGHGSTTELAFIAGCNTSGGGAGSGVGAHRADEPRSRCRSRSMIGQCTLS